MDLNQTSTNNSNYPRNLETTENSKWNHSNLAQIKDFVLQKNYPCVAAIKSVLAEEYIVRHYEDFGTGLSWRDLRRDLESFIIEQEKTNSTYLTFWAVFSDSGPMSEQVFEKAMWNELSHLTSVEKREKDWGKMNVSSPEDPGFCLSLNGKAFFVVGLHPGSSRKGRQFAKPSLVFNVIQQFENLEIAGEYEPMKTAIRKRDRLFQGSVNPMVEAHGDHWESIQFSGMKSDTQWKCPFRFLLEKLKP